MRTILFKVLIVSAMLGCAERLDSTTTRQKLTLEQKAQVHKLLNEKGVLTYEQSPLIGRKAAEEQALLSLADATGSRTDGSTFYYFQVWRPGRPLDFDGPGDEGDGGVTIEVVNGVIIKSSYVVAEF